MDAMRLAEIVMKNIAEAVQPVINALAKRLDDGIAGLRADYRRDFAELEERINRQLDADVRER